MKGTILAAYTYEDKGYRYRILVDGTAKTGWYNSRLKCLKCLRAYKDRK